MIIVFCPTFNYIKNKTGLIGDIAIKSGESQNVENGEKNNLKNRIAARLDKALLIFNFTSNLLRLDFIIKNG